ncbi:hypothetical protein [Lapidilactobacillus salsurivasis]
MLNGHYLWLLRGLLVLILTGALFASNSAQMTNYRTELQTSLAKESLRLADLETNGRKGQMAPRQLERLGVITSAASQQLGALKDQDQLAFLRHEQAKIAAARRYQHDYHQWLLSAPATTSRQQQWQDHRLLEQGWGQEDLIKTTRYPNGILAIFQGLARPLLTLTLVLGLILPLWAQLQRPSFTLVLLNTRRRSLLFARFLGLETMQISADLLLGLVSAGLLSWTLGESLLQPRLPSSWRYPLLDGSTLLPRLLWLLLGLLLLTLIAAQILVWLTLRHWSAPAQLLFVGGITASALTLTAKIPQLQTGINPLNWLRQCPSFAAGSGGVLICLLLLGLLWFSLFYRGQNKTGHVG